MSVYQTSDPLADGHLGVALIAAVVAGDPPGPGIYGAPAPPWQQGRIVALVVVIDILSERLSFNCGD